MTKQQTLFEVDYGQERTAFGDEKPPARDKWITVRVTEEEHALLTKAAAKEKTTVGKLVRRILGEALKT